MEMGIEILYKGVVEMSLEKAKTKGEPKQGMEGVAAACGCSRLHKKLTVIDLTGLPIKLEGRLKLV